MSLYKPNNFSYRDALPADHPEKVIKGETFDVEFEAIERALNGIVDPNGDGILDGLAPEDHTHVIDDVEGLQAALDGKVGQSAFNQEIQDRIDGDKALQDQIDALDPDGDRKVDWSEIQGKPSEFPPSAHNHAWDQITGKPSEFPPADHNHDGDYLKTETDPTVPDHVKAITTDDIDNWNASGGGASTWDEITGKPTEFPPEAHNQDWSTITNTPSKYPPEDHTHSQSEVDGLELRLDAIEDSITSGGGFVDAPNDGQLYGRQSENWAEIVIPDHLWEQNGSDIYYNNGNVGIGIDSANARLEVSRLGTAETITDLDGNTGLVVSKGGGTDTSGACAAFVGGDQTTITGITMGGLTDPRQSRILHSNIDDSLNFHTGNQASPRLTIDDTGDATFSGNVGIQSFVINTNSIYRTTADCGGLKFTTNSTIIPTDNTGTNSDGQLSLGSGASQRFKDAHFSDTVNAGAVKVVTSANSTNAITLQGPSTKTFIRSNGVVLQEGVGGINFSSGNVIGIDSTGANSTGNVGLGTATNPWGAVHAGELNIQKELPSATLVDFINTSASSAHVLRINSNGAGFGTKLLDVKAKGISCFTVLGDGESTFSGKVGIGMTPAMKLKAWKEAFDTRLKAEPKANKEAVLRDITDGAFGVMPTEEIVAEWMEGRAAGDALQVQGSGSFTGTVNCAVAKIDANINSTNAFQITGTDSSLHARANGTIYRVGFAGLQFVADTIRPADGTGSATSADAREVSLGASASTFKDAHFSGTVNAGSAYIKQGTLGNRGGAQFGSANGFLQLNNTFTHFEPSTDAVVELGSTATRFKNAFFSGTVNAGAFVGDGSGLTNLPSSGPTYTAGNGISISSNQIAMKGSYTGNFSATGTITGTDCIATSDERLKDNITTAPVGLIDHLKGREWDWLETREKGSGVVAQELEKVLPHLVHEDDEGMKSVSYNGLVAYLIEEVKALKAEVETLRNG